MIVTNSPFRLIVLMTSLVIVQGCTTIPSPLQGEFNEFYPEQAVERSAGAQVRWGGTIIRTLPENDQTCIEILARQLDPSYRPISSDQTFGRFLACRSVFIDPEVFVNDRQVTITGAITGFSEQAIGEFTYRYPVVQAEAIYLWPEYIDVWRGRHYPYYWW